MELLERGLFVHTLDEYAADAASGSGRFVLLSGEAGVGKTSLLEVFRELHPEVRCWWGACDGSFTPRPLGPLYEIALEAKGRLLEVCTDDVDRREQFAVFLDELDDATVVVIEDLHWADDATLDWLRYVSRRIAKKRALVIASYRDDEPGTDTPLRDVIGQIATHPATRRMALPALSPEAVRQLAGDATTDIDELYRVTGGVPFYVGEVLTVAPGEVPRTVADIVTARMAQLTPPARQLLAAAAVIGRPADPALLAGLADVDASALDECLESGTLVGGPDLYRFRHELTRMAVERAIPAHRRSALHADALTIVAGSRPDDYARLAHHAESAGDARQALQYATCAARDALAKRSHREAVAQFRRALRFADHATEEQRAELHEGLAVALSFMDHWAESAVERDQALELRRRIGDPIKISADLRGLARCEWRLCRGKESVAASREALDLMSEMPPSAERAWAHAIYAVTDIEAPDVALAYAQEALRQGEEVGCAEVCVYTLNTVGMYRLMMGEDGLPDLNRSVELALQHGFEEQAARGYANLYEGAVDRFRAADFDWSYTDGMAYCRDNDMRTFAVCLRGTRAAALLNSGQLVEAVTLAERTMLEQVSPVNRLALLVPLVNARLRHGDPYAELLDEAWQLATDTAERPRLLAIARSQSESAWLDGRSAALDPRVSELYESCSDADDPWQRGALAVWMDRLGRPVRTDDGLPEPYARELRGDYSGAAAWWREAGCPFDDAVVESRRGDAAALRRALEKLTAIDAIPAAAMVRRRMRQAGHHGAPRGPRAATRSHPDGLTAREVEVLALLREGLSNADIARRLFISERTVHKHVSAIFLKLQVNSRTALLHT